MTITLKREDAQKVLDALYNYEYQLYGGTGSTIVATGLLEAALAAPSAEPLPKADWTIQMRRMLDAGKCSKRECRCKPEDTKSCIWWDEPEATSSTTTTPRRESMSLKLPKPANASPYTNIKYWSEQQMQDAYNQGLAAQQTPKAEPNCRECANLDHCNMSGLSFTCTNGNEFIQVAPIKLWRTSA